MEKQRRIIIKMGICNTSYFNNYINGLPFSGNRSQKELSGAHTQALDAYSDMLKNMRSPKYK